MYRPNALSAAISGILLSATLVPANVVLAQDEEILEEIITTGSRITDPNLEQASQILVMSEAEILERHVLDAESLVGELPGIAPGTSRSSRSCIRSTPRRKTSTT